MRQIVSWDDLGRHGGRLGRDRNTNGRAWHEPKPRRSHTKHAKGAIEKAAGYAVFSNFGMKILVAGGGSGKGFAVDNKTKKDDDLN